MNDAVTVEDAVSTKIKKKDPLYAERVRVYPKAIKGRFRSLKWAALIVLLAIYYIVPWIRWDRGPDAPGQAVLVDIVNGRLYFFWIEIWPQEVYYLTGLLVLGRHRPVPGDQSVGGRVWCGYHLSADGLDRSLHVGRASRSRATAMRTHSPRQVPAHRREGAAERSLSSTPHLAADRLASPVVPG